MKSTSKKWGLWSDLVAGSVIFLLIVSTSVALGQSQYQGETSSEGIPVQIAWQVPLSRDVNFIMEVARDSGFGQRVFETQVRGTGHYFIAPAEGVYHWRLSRADKKGLGGEVLSTVSGSFVAVDPKAERDEPAKVTWKPSEGADSYKIYILDQDGRTRILTATATFVMVPKNIPVTMIEVIPQRGALSLQRSYHFLPTLGFFSGRKPKNPVPSDTPIAAASPGVADQAKPKTATSENAGLETKDLSHANNDKSGGLADMSLGLPVPPLSRRLHAVSLRGGALAETLSLEKQDMALENDFEAPFGFFGVVTSPIDGFLIHLDATGWRLSGDLVRNKTQVDQGGLDWGQPFSGTRFLVTAGLGVDFLGLLAVEDGQLGLSLVAGSTSYPTLPTTYTIPSRGTPFPQKPNVSDKIETLGGAKFLLQWDFKKFGLGFEATYLTDTERRHKVMSSNMVFDFFLTHSIVAQIGAHGQQAEFTDCESDNALCLTEGKILTSSRVKAFGVGLGYVVK